MKAIKKSKILVMNAALLGMVAFSACNVNDGIEDGNQPQAVRFSAGIANQAVQNDAPITKAAGTIWASGDAIGVFMVEKGMTTIAENAVNRQYTTTGNSTFTTASGQDIYYPMDGSAVDFIAYYPYATGKAISDQLSVNVSGAQTAASQAAIDLLWAKANNNGSGYTKATPNVALSFDHKLSKIVMNVKAAANVNASLTGMTVSIGYMNTENTFNLSTGTFGTPGTPAAITPCKLATAKTGFDASYDAVILPGTYPDGMVTVTFTVGGEPFVWKIPATTFNSGAEYTYAITLTRTEVKVTGTIKPWAAGPNNLTGEAE
ncbi:MAG: fimbrillin family protein [Tannerellaceae bacterium]|jgi:hypothetical protein|nr:fimbrillin family protein [Tannerellaceae bacterium]